MITEQLHFSIRKLQCLVLVETTIKVDGGRPKRRAVDDPLSDDDHVVEELCQLLKLTREEYYSLKEFESKPCKLIFFRSRGECNILIC